MNPDLPFGEVPTLVGIPSSLIAGLTAVTDETRVQRRVDLMLSSSRNNSRCPSGCQGRREGGVAGLMTPASAVRQA